jgi:hypothetical protein
MFLRGGVFFLSWKNSAVLIFLGFTALDLGPSALIHNLRPAPVRRCAMYYKRCRCYART